MESRLVNQTNLSASEPKTTHSAFIMLLFWFMIAMSWWLLAFWPASEINSWLSRTQQVCFGKMPGQPLPFSGWILLFGGPLFLLTALIVVYGSEILKSLKLLSHNRGVQISLYIVSAIFVIESAWIVFRVNQDSSAISAIVPIIDESKRLPDGYLRTHQSVKDFTLISQNGEKISSKQLIGKPTILTFIYAHCATMCPMLLKQVTKSIETIGAQNVRGVFITLDPWRDKPSRLSSLSEQWKIPNGSLLLSGEVEKVLKVHKDFNLLLERDAKTGEIIHPGLIYIIDQKGEIAYTFNSPPVQWIVDAYQKVLKD